MIDSERHVFLKGGVVVPVEPVTLLLDLERRGFYLARDGGDVIIQPFSRLTDEDKADIRKWKPEVLTLLSYVAPDMTQ